MSLPNYLQNIKSSGIYRFVFDNSEIPGSETNTLRLVVGYSEKGPFNTPVYIENESQFKKVYGGISKKLERYGVWFHRMALQALKKGPILALSLKPFSTETVEAVSFNPQSELGTKINLAVEDVYNTTRFWTLEPEQFENIDKTMNQYITISQTDSNNMSTTIFVRGYEPTGYDITFKEWYSSVLNGEELPTYLQGYELEKLSQYFAEIYVFRGEFTPALASSDKLSKFFNITGDTVTLKDSIKNAFGEDIDTLEALANSDYSNFIGRYSGIILPDFQNAYGSVLSLDLIFNNDYQSHKMMMHFNKALLYDADLADLDAFTINKLDTTGWTNGTTGMMSFTKLDPVISTLKWVVTQEAKEATKDSEAVPEIASWQTQDTEKDPNFTIYDFTDEPTAAGNVLTCSHVNELGLAEGDKFLTNTNTIATLVKIDGDNLTFDVDASTVSFALTDTKKTAIKKCEKSVTTTSKNLVPTYIKGYTYVKSRPENTKQMSKLKWQNDILDTLVNYKGIRLALTNNTDSRWRYLVDTFEAFVDTECHSRLAMICKEKFNCLGLLNFPSMKSFINCDYTSFKDDNNKLDVKYIAKGGNSRKSMTTKFSLVSEENGASFVGYYTPLNIQDTYTGVKYTCPSAALMSNNYIDKWTTRYPYSIVAGPNYSVVTDSGLIGPDFNFSRADLDVLEPMGVNCMVYIPLKGIFANSQQTAKQNPVTTLSKISTREIVTYIQDEIEELLQNYQWEFNTQTLRNTIKDRADVILDRIKNNGGINTYLTVCDATNNTSEVINNEMLLLDISIEPGMGAGKMVQRLYLYRNGGLSSTVTE